ncbi:hypothetical protein [Microbulbifer sp. ALW1]|uniref:hypothetical protein n=1 Tax=Microbulbifer sp. (strain ALW1) TaxID=1516059 RepID=UPI00135CADB8|nr:hypothetical protein [Microbulbifer sp. ALW1]
MSFQIRFLPDTRIVSVVFFGPVDLEQKLASAGQVGEKYGHLHPLRVLVDVRQAEIKLTLEERKQFGRFVAEHTGTSHGRVAVLHSLEHNPNHTIDQAALAAGLTLAEFLTERAAEEWLLSH